MQPLDLTVNKPAKEFLRGKFEEWYAEQIHEQGTAAPITFLLHTMKPLGATWIKELCTYLTGRPDIIQNGFRAAGITSTLS